MTSICYVFTWGLNCVIYFYVLYIFFKEIWWILILIPCFFLWTFALFLLCQCFWSIFWASSSLSWFPALAGAVYSDRFFYFERVDRKLSRFSRSNFQWKLDILRAWAQQQAGTSQPVVLFLFSLCVLGVLLSPPTSACSHGGSGCVNAGPWSLVAACARSEKEEKVDDEFSVKAARLGAG